eukprot:954977-Prymnesium_polylepis.1
MSARNSSSPLLVSSPTDQIITLAPRGRRMSARSARVRTAAMVTMAQLVREEGSSCGWADALHRLAGARADAIPTTG